MRSTFTFAPALAAAIFVAVAPADAGQPPFAAGTPDIPVSHQDRVYAAEQYSNTISVTEIGRASCRDRV